MNRAEKRAQGKAQQKQEKAMMVSAIGCSQLAARYMPTEPNRSYELLTRAIKRSHLKMHSGCIIWMCCSG